MTDGFRADVPVIKQHSNEVQGFADRVNTAHSAAETTMDTNAFGIFGFSFLDQNADKLQGHKVDGVEPTFENIAAGDYKVSRSLFIYAKKEHVGVIPGMEEFISEYTSDAAWGPEGYLADKGLIPLPDDQREQSAADAKALKGMGS